MYLKSIRIRGFKSFPGSVELQFHEGIAVIVGPNGSGKSNIADALQWAMATQAPAQLRAPLGQDVLFSGSDARPPAGVCEVELVLDNSCGTLPLEFEEVSVMRRLHREREGEYFINRARVRRLDLLELMADTGLGREMHSVIGQGKVEEILLSKPHERRRFVEEAAGLGKYQRRRARAETKMVRVASELERARDLEREVKARLRPLSIQATAADRAAKLAGEIAVGRVTLLSSEMLTEQRSSAGLDGRRAAAAQTHAAVEKKLEGLAARRALAESELTGLAAAQERAAHSFYAFETARERLDLQAGRVAQGAAALDRARGRRTAAAERLAADAARFTAESLEASATADQAALEVDRLGVGDVEAERALTAQAEAALTAALDARRALADAQGQVATTRREAEQSAGRLAAHTKQMETFAGRAETTARDLEGAGALAEAAAKAGEAAAMELAAATAAATAATEAEATAAESDRAARAALDELTHRSELAATRLAGLDRALERGEGLPPAARSLQAAGAKLVVAGIEAEQGYERAVAAALGWRAGAVVADKVGEAIELLRGAEGELAVILAGAELPAAGKAPAPGARPLLEVATVTDPAVGRLIAGVWLVDDLSQVRSGVAVTASGEGVDADRGEFWRAADAGEAAWLSARAERDRTRVDMDEIAVAAKAAASRAAEAAATASAAAASAGAARDAQAAAVSADTAAREAARALSLRREQLTDELARCDAARDLAERDLETERARAAALTSDLEAHEALEAERRTASTSAEEQHSGLERRRREMAEQGAVIAAQVAGLGERVARGRAEFERLQAAAAEATATALRAVELGEIAADLAPECEAISAKLALAAQAANELRTPARAGVESIERRASELSTELQACAELEAAEQAASRAATAAATEIEVSLGRSAERVSELGRRRSEIAAAHELELSEPEQPMQPDESSALAARLERLERRRESLGAVNPLAAEEYEAEKVRVDELSTQCDDLDRSLKELRSLVRDLTQTIDARFDETFKQVAHHFSETVGTLFPGGSGRLRLTDDVVEAPVRAAEDGEEPAEDAEDQLPAERPEPGIELEVRPAGKRIESLSLLSGGEKSLTAIAFQFSLMLTKPSPFYVLDEVEAALDDANIERFLSLLRAYQSRAQFIVITHQRRTMEVADVLYGVSMAGDGESRVLSRRMSDSLEPAPEVVG